MKTDELLTLKALQLKSSIYGGTSGSDLVDSVLSKNPEIAKEAMRNICAFISPELFQKVEIVCANLEMSKRQVVELALIDFMEKVDSIMEKINPFEGLNTDDQGQPVSSSRQVEGE